MAFQRKKCNLTLLCLISYDACFMLSYSKPFKGGVDLADVTKSSRSFGSRGSESIECPVDIDDYMVAPSVFPENDDGEFIFDHVTSSRNFYII